MSKRKRDDENSYNERNDSDDFDEEYLLEDNDDARNHQEKDKRPANKRAQLLFVYEQNWMGMYQKLIEYKKEHKTTTVPAYYEEDPKLGWWVTTQRTAYKNDKLLPNRHALLNSVGFNWEGAGAARQQITWMNMYRKLVAYKKLHNNTMVPIQYKKDLKLGHWVAKQRHHYIELLPERLALLNSIDFN